MQQVIVRVPGSTSNLGPGFDCFGLALRLYNFVTVGRRRGTSLSPMLQECGAAFFQASNSKEFDFSVSVRGDVPIARGLGSSVTVRLGLLLGLNGLAGNRLTRSKLFRLCAQLEGHPDNAAPASFGGFTIATGGSLRRFSVSSQLKIVLLVPERKIATDEARQLLPREVSRQDAINNIANAAAIAAAFAARDYSQLRGCFIDRLHQPYRKKLMPFLDDVVAAAERVGALGAFLSGSGSAICALTLRDATKVAQAMRGASRLKEAGTIITSADNRGAAVVKPGSL